MLHKVDDLRARKAQGHKLPVPPKVEYFTRATTVLPETEVDDEAEKAAGTSLKEVFENLEHE